MGTLAWREMAQWLRKPAVLPWRPRFSSQYSHRFLTATPVPEGLVAEHCVYIAHVHTKAHRHMHQQNSLEVNSENQKYDVEFSKTALGANRDTIFCF